MIENRLPMEYWIAGGYASEHGGANAEGHSYTPRGESPIKNAGHSAGGAGPSAGGVYDDESATV